MAVPQHKDELISAIQYTYSKLKQDLDTIPPELTNDKTLDGHAKGTSMSICNLVSYLIGWGELVLKWHKQKALGNAVDFPETGYKWNALGQLAQKFYSDYEHLDYEALLTRLDSVVTEILDLIDNTKNEDLYHKPWYDKWTQGKMIQLNTSSPYKNARSRVRKWKRMNVEKLK